LMSGGGCRGGSRLNVVVVGRVVYLVNGESDAPAGEEQRAPANGWWEL
jgi:hypothetical protein